MDSPVVNYPGFAVAVMLDARSILKSHPAATVITHVNAYHVAAVNYPSGSVAAGAGSVGIVGIVGIGAIAWRKTKLMHHPFSFDASSSTSLVKN